MNVLLLKNVKGLGVAGQLVDVPRGFAVNKLIPGKCAKFPSTEEELKAEVFVPNVEKDSSEFVEWAKATVVKLSGKTLLFSGKASDKGHLFGSISESDIAERIKADFDVEIDESQINITKKIKDLGDNRVEIVFSPEFHAALTVRVEASK
ncbi:MAG TPA: 50S ribosomal protein L9 [Bacteroidia bacterium]|nr:50S ribosomal protein L9 [Bacteroidia bacterium]HIQ57508.1 50S ribosomal protein L9 [Candidatus Gracilibacteria bacterium]